MNAQELIRSLVDAGERIDSKATTSVKTEDGGATLARIGIGDSVRLDEVLSTESLVLAAAAGSGGTLQTSDGLNSGGISALGCAVAVNRSKGMPISEEDAIDAACIAANRKAVTDRVAEFNRRQADKRAAIAAESERRFHAAEAMEVRSSETVAAE